MLFHSFAVEQLTLLEGVLRAGVEEAAYAFCAEALQPPQRGRGGGGGGGGGGTGTGTGTGGGASVLPLARSGHLSYAAGVSLLLPALSKLSPTDVLQTAQHRHRVLVQEEEAAVRRHALLPHTLGRCLPFGGVGGGVEEGEEEEEDGGGSTSARLFWHLVAEAYSGVSREERRYALWRRSPFACGGVVRSLEAAAEAAGGASLSPLVDGAEGERGSSTSVGRPAWYTDMVSASEAGSLERLCLLRYLGATAEKRGVAGHGCLALAAARGHAACVPVLAAMGAGPAEADGRGVSALHAAAAGGRDACVRAVLALGVAVDLPDAGGWTPLHHALHNGHEGTAALLQANGAAQTHCDAFGLVPIEPGGEGGGGGGRPATAHLYPAPPSRLGGCSAAVRPPAETAWSRGAAPPLPLPQALENVMKGLPQGNAVG